MKPMRPILCECGAKTIAIFDVDRQQILAFCETCKMFTDQQNLPFASLRGHFKLGEPI